MSILSKHERESGHRAVQCSNPDCGGTCNACFLFLCELCGQAEDGLEKRCPLAPRVVFLSTEAGNGLELPVPLRYFTINKGAKK